MKQIGDLYSLKCTYWALDIGHFVESKSFLYPTLYILDGANLTFSVLELDIELWGHSAFPKESMLMDYILRRNIEPKSYTCLLFNKELDIWDNQ